MNVTKILTICLAGIGGASGIIAARYWHESSKISVVPMWGDFEPLETEDKALGLTLGTLDAFTQSATLNKKAARWTAVSVLLSAISGVLGNVLGND